MYTAQTIPELNPIEFIRNSRKIFEENTILNSKPTNENIEELKLILHDFRIKEKIPEFNTLRELNNWRKKMIINKLENYRCK